MNSLRKPLVSIIVPIYNSEKYLHRCMDSLVNQTLKDIEIIAVNNGSTDSSLDILNKYGEEYPSKVKVHTIPHAERAGAGRNYGIRIAEADYIGFCDSDDFMDYYAFEKLYEKAIQEDSDIVYSDFYHVIDQQKKLISIKNKKNLEKADLLLHGNLALWNKLYKKELLLESGSMPEEFGFEDFAYYPIVVSKACKISYLQYPTYYYIVRKNSEVNAATSIRMLDALKAAKYSYSNIEESDRQICLYGNINRLLGTVRERWVFFDAYIQFFSEMKTEIENFIPFCRNERIYKTFLNYCELAKAPMDENVFVNGFARTYEEVELEEISKSAFYDNCNVIVLNEEECFGKEDVIIPEVIQEAYDAGMYDFVGKYFAVKYINEMGGIYVDESLTIDYPLNFTKHLNAFFGFEDDTQYTDKIFGGKKKQKVWELLIETYENVFYDDKFISLASRIRNICCAYYNIPLAAMTNLYTFPVAIFAPDVFMIKEIANFHSSTIPIHFTHLKKYNDIGNEMQHVLETLFGLHDHMLKNEAKRDVEELIRNNANKERTLLALQRDYNTLKENRDFLQYRLNEIEKSRSWRISQKFIGFSKTFFGKPIKWFLLKIIK